MIPLGIYFITVFILLGVIAAMIVVAASERKFIAKNMPPAATRGNKRKSV